MRKIRVLVFGTTGTGKTSLCNNLTRGARAVGNGPKGVTSKTHIYPAFTVGDDQIEIVDTAGLNEAVEGTVPPEEAIKQILLLLQSAAEGFSLLIHVMRMGRLTKDHAADYKFFVEKLGVGDVPAILAVTGCENEQPMSGWVNTNRDAFEGYAYKEIVATCCAKGGPLEPHFAPLREQSREEMIAAMRSCALPEPKLLYGAGTGTTFKQLASRLWNEFADLAGLAKELRWQLNETTYEFLKRQGVPQKVAKLLVTHIPDLWDELPIPFGRGWLKKKTRWLLKKIFRK
jgi:hypothetical protein